MAIKTMLLETLEYLMVMSDVIFWGIRVDQDVVEINNDSDI